MFKKSILFISVISALTFLGCSNDTKQNANDMLSVSEYVLTGLDKKVAVLAVDPTSRLSKGSILGDKTRMETLVKNPNAFIPDRFISGTPQLGYIPFGAGARLCIGKEMARLEGSQILAHIASTWNIEAVHGSAVPIDASVTLRPESGMPVRISRLLD